MVQSSPAADGLRKAVEKMKKLPTLDLVLQSIDITDDATVRDNEEVDRKLRLPYSSDPVAIIDRWK